MNEKIDRTENVGAVEAKEPIMPIMRRMAVGEEHGWDKRRYNAVRTIRHQVEMQECVRFKTKTVGDQIVVTRIK